MKSILSAIALLLISATAFAQYDDVYYTPGDNTQEYTEYQNNDTGNTYITNNYYDNTQEEYVFEDDYDYLYSSRIRRFHRPYRGMHYFSNVYVDPYYYGASSSFWGNSIYYDPFLTPVAIYNPFWNVRPGFSVSFGWGNVGWNRPYHTGFGWNNWNSWAYNPLGFGYPYAGYYGNPYGNAWNYCPSTYVVYNDYTNNNTRPNNQYYGPRGSNGSGAYGNVNGVRNNSPSVVNGHVVGKTDNNTKPTYAPNPNAGVGAVDNQRGNTNNAGNTDAISSSPRPQRPSTVNQVVRPGTKPAISTNQGNSNNATRPKPDARPSYAPRPQQNNNVRPVAPQKPNYAPRPQQNDNARPSYSPRPQQNNNARPVAPQKPNYTPRPQQNDNVRPQPSPRPSYSPRPQPKASSSKGNFWSSIGKAFSSNGDSKRSSKDGVRTNNRSNRNRQSTYSRPSTRTQSNNRSSNVRSSSRSGNSSKGKVSGQRGSRSPR